MDRDFTPLAVARTVSVVRGNLCVLVVARQDTVGIGEVCNLPRRLSAFARARTLIAFMIDHPRARRRARRTTLIGAGVVLVAMLSMAAAWRWTPLQEVAEPGMIIHWLRESADSRWMPLIVGALFVGASWVLFPNTVLSLGVILALGPMLGTAYAFGGSMLAALVGYSMGRWGHRRIEKLRIGAFDQISKQLRRGGFFQVLAVRVLPVAPFSATNILAGAVRVRLVPFAAATAIGIAPYIVTFGLFGHQARRLMLNPTPSEVAVTAAIVVLAAVVAYLAHSRWKYA